MIASFPVQISQLLETTPTSSEKADKTLEHGHFPRIGSDRTKKDSHKAPQTGIDSGTRALGLSGLMPKTSPLLRAETSPERSLPLEKCIEKPKAFTSRAKSGNLAKFEKSVTFDKDGKEPSALQLPSLPLVSNVPSKKPFKSPHRLGFVKPHQYARLEAFNIYKTARRSATVNRLRALGTQGRPNTPTDLPRRPPPKGDPTPDPGEGPTADPPIGGGSPLPRTISRISFPNPGSPELAITPLKNWPSRNRAADKSPERDIKSPIKESRPAKSDPEEDNTRPSLKVMNFEPVIIPDEMRPAPARSPPVPFYKPNDFFAGSGAWVPGQTDKPRNILRPSGGYGKHRAPAGPDTSPVSQVFSTVKVPNCLQAPLQETPAAIRLNYARNLERNWLKRMREENARKKRDKTIRSWLVARSRAGKMNFESSFFSSDSESESEVGGEVVGGYRFGRLQHSASLDVLLSDTDPSEGEHTQDISIVLKDGLLTDKMVNNKMRRKRWTRRKKFTEIVKATRELEIAERVAAAIGAPANREMDPEYFGGIDGMTGEADIDLAIDEMRYFQDAPDGGPMEPIDSELELLTDKEIRAMRLKLKNKEPANPLVFNTEQFRALAAEILAGLKGKDKKPKKKKKKKTSKTGKKVKWNKNDDYNEYERKTPVQVTVRDQFIQDFGHWLDTRVDWRLEQQMREGVGSGAESGGEGEETADGAKEDASSEKEKEPCSTELALRDFGDDYRLLTNILLETRRPYERYIDLTKGDKTSADIENTPRIENVILAGMVATNESFKLRSYEDLHIPTMRRQSDPGLERLKLIKFTVPVKKRKALQRKNSRSGSCTRSISGSRRRSSTRSIASDASELSAKSSRTRRPMTPGVYKVRRRISHERITSGKSDVSDDNISVKSYASSRMSGRSGRRRVTTQHRSSRSSSNSPQKRPMPRRGSSSVTSRRRSSSIFSGAAEVMSPDSTSSSEHVQVTEEVEYIIDLDDVGTARPSSARPMARAEPEVDLWDLTKGIDFPAKDIKIKIINRKRRRQRKKRQMMKQAETVRDLQKANKKAEDILAGKPPESPNSERGDTSSDLSSSEDEKEEGEKENESEVPKPMTFALDSPFVSACVAWNTSSRVRLKLSNEELDEQIRNLGSLFREMMECRYIRWSARDWAIIERLYELELLE